MRYLLWTRRWKEERDAVIDFVSQLPQKNYNVLRYEFINQKNDSPFIIALESFFAVIKSIGIES
ncbi:hypothetical protein UACE39S_04487 [Ureibacillus acetophenoni]